MHVCEVTVRSPCYPSTALVLTGADTTLAVVSLTGADTTLAVVSLTGADTTLAVVSLTGAYTTLAVVSLTGGTVTVYTVHGHRHTDTVCCSSSVQTGGERGQRL